MQEAQWAAVDGYIDGLFVGKDAALEAALADSAAGGLPNIQVSPSQGKLLMVLAMAVGARRVLEVGTLGGYSTIWLGRAVPEGGQVISLEVDLRHAEVARRNVARAGLSNCVEVRVGRALETLPRLAAEPGAPFDLVFIDADKENYPAYLEWAVRLSRKGTLIVADNVVRGGEVLDEASTDERVRGARRFNAQLAGEARVAGTILQCVGAKGYDGLALAVVTADPA